MEEDFLSSFEQALDACEDQRFEDMLKHAEAMIEAEKENSLGYQVRGEALLELGQHAKALEDFNHSIDLKPTKDDVYLLRGSTLVHFLRFKEARNDFNFFIKRHPENPDGYEFRGIAYHHEKCRKECISDLEKALALGADNEIIPFYVGVSYFHLNNFEQAISWLDKAAPVMQDSTVLFLSRGCAHFFLGHWRRCADDMSHCLYLDGHDPRPYFLRSQAKFNMNDKKGSEADFKKLKKMNPELAKAMTQGDYKGYTEKFGKI